MPGHRQISLQGGGDKTSKRRLSPDAFITAPLPSFITRGDGVEEVGGGATKSSGGIVGMPRMLADPAASVSHLPWL